MSRAIDLALDIAAEIAKTRAGREAVGTLLSVVVGSFFLRPCPHPFSRLIWLNNREAVCGRCGRKVKRAKGGDAL